MNEGTKLTTASRIRKLRRPRDDQGSTHAGRGSRGLHTGDGHIQCDLPLVMDTATTQRVIPGTICAAA